jgi:D-apiose dehydrogenase
MAELKGALIGCGFFAINHLNAWRDIAGEGGARIVAICDKNEKRLAEVQALFGIERTYTDAGEMFEKEALEFVDIATTAPSHRALVELAAGKRIPAICQKPFAPVIEDARAMVEACEKAGVPLMVHENFRWQSALIKVRDAIRSGRIGTPYWGRVSFRSGYDIYAGQPYLAEGERFIVEDLGVHVLDTARFLFGDVDRLTARLQRINPRVKGEDAATMLLGHESGVTSVVDCSYTSRQEEELFPQTIVEIDGSEGSIRLKPNYVLSVTGSDGRTVTQDVSPLLLPWASKPWHNIQESVLLIQKHWVECLRTGREPSTSGRDNLKTFQLVEAAYLSGRTGETVNPGDI